MNIHPSSFPHPPSPVLPHSIPLSDSPAVLQGRDRAGSGSGPPTPRLPLSAMRMGHGSHPNHGFYSPPPSRYPISPPPSRYPISPPLSPESPLGTPADKFDEPAHKSEGELAMEIAGLKEVWLSCALYAG